MLFGRRPQASPVSLSQARLPLAFLIGLATGLFSGLLGVGGGVLIVPAMVYLLRLRQHEANATSLIVIIPIALVGALILGRSHAVDLAAALVVATGSIAGAVLGARLSRRLSPVTLRRLFGLAAVSIGLLMIATLALQALHLAFPNPGVRAGGVALWTIGVAIGLLTGLLSGLLGIGGGVVMVPAMVFGLGLTQHVAQGTSLAVVIPTAMVAALAHTRMGNIRLQMAATLTAGGVLGASLGALTGLLASDQTLAVLFAAYLVTTGAAMMRGERAGRAELQGQPTMSR